MSGINQVLDIAKRALQAHQLSVQVASNNIANVDTPGYTRQSAILTPSPSVNSPVGALGVGVSVETILRQYDQFTTQRIIGQNSILGNLEALRQTLGSVEAIFNEAPGLAVNDLMGQFWDSWQAMANNPENLSSRDLVIQQGQLVADQLQNMYAEITKVRSDINSTLSGTVDAANTLIREIADLNRQITAAETDIHQANDLRDQRDEKVKELSRTLDISYFETGNHSYSVLLPDGHSLVQDSDYSVLSWETDTLFRLSDASANPTKTQIGSGTDLGGAIGGLLAMRDQLAEGDPTNYLGRLDAFANALIREVNQQHAQGVGLTTYASGIIGTETAYDMAALSSAVDAALSGNTIPANTLEINGKPVGTILGAPLTHGLAMEKAGNAVAAINNAAAGVTASLTTLLAGDAVTPMAPADVGTTISFTVNGVAVNYTVAAGDTAATTLATNVAAAISAAVPGVNAVRGDGTNGGAADSIVLSNANSGDASAIVISGIAADPSGLAANLGLADGAQGADAAHNTGDITLFSAQAFTMTAGPNDTYLAELGMVGVNAGDIAGDGRFTYSFADGGIAAALAGYEYGDQVQTGGGFDIWLYNSDGTAALPQPVTVNLTGARTLNDVANAINTAITTATGGTAWLTASVNQNRLQLSPDGGHNFAFANDTANILQAAGINTLFSGHSAGTIGINDTIADNPELLAAATVGGLGEIFAGDNSNGLLLTSIQQKETVAFTGGVTGSLDDFYNGLVGEIGVQSQAVDWNLESNTLVMNALSEMRDSVSGVSLDEEMANLIKFQQAYAAAAKLISASDEMYITLLNTL